MKNFTLSILLLSSINTVAQIPTDLLQKAESGNADAQATIATKYKYGTEVEKNLEKAFYWFHKAAVQGNVKSQLNLGYMFYNGKGTPKNLDSALYWHKQAAAQGNAEAMDQIGFLHGFFGFKDYATAAIWYEKAFNNGHTSSATSLADLYEQGKGVPKSLDKAKYWYEQCAKTGFNGCQEKLDQLTDVAASKPENATDKGNQTTSNKVTTATKQAPISTTKKSLEAKELLSKAQDLANEDNFIEAFNYVEQAALLGDAEGQFLYGGMLIRGQGTPKEDEKGFIWINKSANQGYSEAMAGLGYCFESGLGVNKDFGKAVEWYLKAAEKGHVQSQDYIGDCYNEGKGVAQNRKEAVKWYIKACENGDKETCAKLQIEDFIEPNYPVREIPTNQANDYYTQAQHFQNQNEHNKELIFLLKASVQNHLQALTRLGYMNAIGVGIENDDERAFAYYKKAATRGWPEAQVFYADCYENGYGTPKNIAKAEEWYLKAAKQNNAKAQYKIGTYYEIGLTNEGIDYSLAIEWYEKAKKNGNTSAQKAIDDLNKKFPQNPSTAEDYFKLGQSYYNSNLPKNMRKGFEYLLKAAQMKNPEAQVALGIAYMNGEGVESNPEEAFNWALKGAKNENSQGQFLVGHMYMNGIGTSKDVIEAIKWYLKACDANVSEACDEISDGYINYKMMHMHSAETLNEKGLQYLNLQKGKVAIAYFLKAAELNYAPSQTTLGILCLNGTIGEPDYEKAKSFFESAETNGSNTASYNLGLLYNNGWGVKKDTEKAFSYFLKSANLNNAEAQGMVAYMLGEGIGVQINLDESFTWYQKAAENGNPTAQYNLANIYAQGLGGKQKDTLLAKKWFQKACENKIKQACEQLK